MNIQTFENLLNILSNLPTFMQKKLEELKRAKDLINRPDFIWHILLQSFATMGNSRGFEGLILNKSNYDRVTFDKLTLLTDEQILNLFESVFKDAKVRMPTLKAKWLLKNYHIINSIGG